MKVTVDPDTASPSGEKSDLELQAEAIIKDRKEEVSKELKASQLQEELSKEPPLRANVLKSSLGGSFEDRMQEEKTIVLTLNYGKRPEVVFSGFWNGKLVNNAMNAISRSYRLQRHKVIRANATIPQQGTI